MKLREFIETFCDGYVNIKIIRIKGNGTSGIPFIFFKGCTIYEIFDTEVFMLIEDIEVVRVKAHEGFLELSIIDNM